MKLNRGGVELKCVWLGWDNNPSWKEPLKKKNIGVLELLIIVIN
jgi:hypothetical protein